MTVGADKPEWDDKPRSRPSASAPVLAVDGFEGPLDWLLDLARSERVDLRKLSILQLVDAFVAALDAALGTPRVDLSRWGEWLGLAAQLAMLRSRLLLPPDAAEARAAQADAEALRKRLLEGAAMRSAAAWLERRPQLGRDVFSNAAVAAPRALPAGDIVDLMRACLVALRVPALSDAYVPGRPPLWRVADAAARITGLLADGIEGELALFLPPIPVAAPERELRCRAALASTFLAGLEFAREGRLALAQGADGAVNVSKALSG